jgi:hypothetical protein
MEEVGALLPITDEQAKLGQEILKTFGGIGSFFKEALGSVPTDLVGYLGGDWLRLRRMENIARMMEQARERLRERGVGRAEPASLTLALPILKGAADESREELRDLWACLLAAALDPERSEQVRQGFAEAISKMDPLDSLVLKITRNGLYSVDDRTGKMTIQKASETLGASKDEIRTSLWNLKKLELVREDLADRHTTAFGREFLRVLSD